MMLLFHITVALSSLVFNSYTYFVPSKSKLNVAYGLMFLTIASGSYLVWSTKANILQTCITGLMYVGASFYGIAAARHRLAAEISAVKKDI